VDAAVDEIQPRTELDSHANMPVLGRHCHILSDTGRTTTVSPYSPDYQPMDLPIVDAAILYQCPFSGLDYILVVLNAIYVPSLRDTPKIQCPNPAEEDHALTFDSTFRIPLQLYGIFSYFPTNKPSLEQLQLAEEVYMLTPERFNPHDVSYALNEDAILDWNGNIVDEKCRQRFLLSDTRIDSIIEQRALNLDPSEERATSVVTEDEKLMEKLLVKRELEVWKSSIGSMNAGSNSPFLCEEQSDSPFDAASMDDQELIDAALDHLSTMDDTLDEIMAAGATAGQSKGVSAQHLSKVWRIDVPTAEKTIELTTQLNCRTHNPRLAKNYGTGDRMLRYKRIGSYFFMDTFFATRKGGKSSRQNTCCQLFVTDRGFVYVVPLRSKSEVLQAVKLFAKEVGAPDAIIADAAKEQQSTELRGFLQSIGTSLRLLEEGTPWANRAELYIGLIKEAVRKDMKDSGCPLPFWDYCVERRARIHNLTASSLFQTRGTNPFTATTNDVGDISSLSQYKFYEWCYFRDQQAAFPNDKEVLGRILGPAKGEGNEMSQWILKSNGRVVPRRTHRPLTVPELHSGHEQEKRTLFDAMIERKYGKAMHGTKPKQADDFEEYSTPEEEAKMVIDIEDTVDASGRMLNQNPAYDKLLQAEVLLQLDGQSKRGKVTQRAVGPDGEQRGRYDENPILNSIVYEIEFTDGTIREYSANIIAENLLNQVDDDGFSTTMLKAIVDYQRDDAVAVPQSEGYVITKSGQRRLRKTTSGWKLLVQWADDSETWIPLRHMKESNPVEVADFARARGIANEPAFAWWVPYTLRKRDVILSAIKSRVRKTTHKYGILVWDIKMDFTRKARWVLDGHKTPDAKISTFAGVVSRDSVRIALTYAALNGLDVCAADIRNAYLQAPSSRKDYIICGPEFGLENVGKVALIHRALYGGKTAGRDFRQHLRSCMWHLNFVSCPADPDVWMRPAIKDNGEEYYEYVLLYTDDALCISVNAEQVLRTEIGKYFMLKEESIGPPQLYLGSNVRQVELSNGTKCWAFGASQYVQAAVKNVHQYLAERHRLGDKRFSLPLRASTPLVTTYRPELDVSPELKPTESAYYQSLIGILRWMVEIGRVDICLEVSLMSSHLALPREGHLEQVIRIFGYLNSHHNTELCFDPTYPDIDHDTYEKRDWTTSEFGHVQGQEELPPNMPQPRGAGFIIQAFVDADHASDTVSRRSRTGMLIYINSSLVYWSSKKQTSVESSSFGSEFVAMKQCCEYLRSLRYKLRMMGIPVDGPCYIRGDNQSVLANTSIPESSLRKKSQSIAYHFVREGVSRDEWRTAYVNTHENHADLLTKVLPNGEKRRNFVRSLLHHIFRSYVVSE